MLNSTHIEWFTAENFIQLNCIIQQVIKYSYTPSEYKNLSQFAAKNDKYCEMKIHRVEWRLMIWLSIRAILIYQETKYSIFKNIFNTMNVLFNEKKMVKKIIFLFWVKLFKLQYFVIMKENIKCLSLIFYSLVMIYFFYILFIRTI